MKIITIGGLPAAGKTYTSKLYAKYKNYLAIEFESMRWDFFNENINENLYRYTGYANKFKNENMREYYLRCALYDSVIPLELMVKWHKATIDYIKDKIAPIIFEIENITSEKKYIDFYRKYPNIINYKPNFKMYNNEYIICSHAFINTIEFKNNERVRIDFKSDINTLINRFKDREKINNYKFDKNIIKYYKSYSNVLEKSKAKILDTNEKEIIEKIEELV